MWKLLFSILFVSQIANAGTKLPGTARIQWVTPSLIGDNSCRLVILDDAVGESSQDTVEGTVLLHPFETDKAILRLDYFSKSIIVRTLSLHFNGNEAAQNSQAALQKLLRGQALRLSNGDDCSDVIQFSKLETYPERKFNTPLHGEIAVVDKSFFASTCEVTLRKGLSDLILTSNNKNVRPASIKSFVSAGTSGAPQATKLTIEFYDDSQAVLRTTEI